MTDSILDPGAARAALTNDPHRPRFHFLPPANWMNDPNGLIQWEGRFHLFYQHNPNGPFWGTMHWGHAVSDDLIHWQDWPIALTPTPGGPDDMGCFSGCTVDDNGVPTIVYTGVRGDQHHIQTQCLATSHDGLRTWKKHPANPVIPTAPRGMNTRDFRDPFVWKEGQMWYAVVGGQMQESGGVALLYRSPDLVNWTYLHPLLAGDPEQHGRMWECPNFFRLDNHYVLLVSVVSHAGVYSFVGNCSNHRFSPQHEGWLHPNGVFFAPLTMRDDRGRRLMWGWIDEERSGEAQRAAGWAGLQSLPILLNVRAGQLMMQPVPELRSLRQRIVAEASDLDLNGEQVINDHAGDMLEIQATFEANSSGSYGLAVRRSADGAEITRILVDAVQGRLLIDRTQSTLDTAQGAAADVMETDFHLDEGETLRLHVFVDRSVIEVFANDRAYLAARIYPSRADSQGLALVGPAKLKSLTAWSLRSIWPG